MAVVRALFFYFRFECVIDRGWTGGGGDGGRGGKTTAGNRKVRECRKGKTKKIRCRCGGVVFLVVVIYLDCIYVFSQGCRFKGDGLVS